MNLSLQSGVIISGEIEGSLSSTLDSPFTDAGLPADFAQLLGEQLNQQLNSQNAVTQKTSLAVATHSASDKSAGNDSKLNALLDALNDMTEILPSGLIDEATSSVNPATEITLAAEQMAQDDSLNALQTLLAMLPQSAAKIIEQNSGAELSAEQHAEEKPWLATELADHDKTPHPLQMIQTMLTLPVTASMQNQNLLVERQTASKTLQTNNKLSSLLAPTSAPDKTAFTDNALPASDSKIKEQIARQKLTTQLVQDTEHSESINTSAAKNLLIPPANNAAPDKILSTLLITPSIPTASSTVTTAMATSSANPSLTAPLGSQEWQQSLGQHLLFISRGGQQRAELHLHPQELGALQISLKIDDNQAQLHFSSAHSQVRAALEAAMPGLRNALAESGIQLGQTSVSSEGASQEQLAQQQSGQNFNREPTSDDPSVADTETLTLLQTPPALQLLATGSGSVDIFA